MVDRAVPNLPSRDFDRTLELYCSFGFTAVFRDDGWMILERGGVQLEFFPYPDLDPAQSSFMCSLRVHDVDELYESIRAAGIDRVPWSGGKSRCDARCVGGGLPPGPSLAHTPR